MDRHRIDQTGASSSVFAYPPLWTKSGWRTDCATSISAMRSRTSFTLAATLGRAAWNFYYASLRESAISADTLLRLARKTVNAVPTCLAITMDSNGANARAINTSRLTEDWTVRFMTDRRTRKVGEIARTGRMTLVYHHQVGGAYVTLVGRASIMMISPSNRRSGSQRALNGTPAARPIQTSYSSSLWRSASRRGTHLGRSSRIHPRAYGPLCSRAMATAGAAPAQPRKHRSIRVSRRNASD
jgi:hypothetical protein